MSDRLCPCGSGLERSACCGPLLSGGVAETAEALMRSRYTAYTEADVGYLARTLAPERRLAFDGEGVRGLSERATWLGLKIVDRADGGPLDSEGTVTFEARYLLDGAPAGFRERSRFRRSEGRWVYVDGDLEPLETPPARKVGRNEPCPCGSGKKFKRCCGR